MYNFEYLNFYIMYLIHKKINNDKYLNLLFVDVLEKWIIIVLGLIIVLEKIIKNILYFLL